MHDEPFAGAIDRDLVEQAGCDQRLQRGIARSVVESSVGRGVKIGANGLGIDAAVALDDDGVRATSVVSARTSRVDSNPSAVAATQPATHRPRQSFALASCV